jgi:hypothetical protein
MSYALFWIEIEAMLLLWIATWTAFLSAAVSRKWRYRLLLTIFVLIPLLSLATLTSAAAILKFSYDFENNWFYYSFALDVAFLAGTIVILRRANRRKIPDSLPNAATWGTGRLSLAFVVVLALMTMTLWNMDLAVRAQAGTMQVEAGALLLDASPPALSDSQNAALLYEKAFDLIKTRERPEDAEVFNADKPNPRDPRILAILQRHDPALALLRQAAVLPDCRFEHATGRFDIESILPEFDRARAAANLLGMRARAQSASGDVAGAMSDVNAMFALARNVGREPLLIGWLLSVGMEAQSNFALQDVLPSVTRPDQLAVLQPPDPAAFGRSHRRALQGEEAMGLTIFSQFCGAQSLGGEMVPPAVYQQFAMPATYRIFLLMDDINGYRRLMAEAKRLATLPYYKSRDQIAHLESPRPIAGPFTSIMASSVTKSFQDAPLVEGLDAASVIAIATTRYRLDHHAYPTKLDDLIPTYLDSIPPDPFDGKPMKLAVRSGQCVIYSLGSNATVNLDRYFEGTHDRGDIFIRLRPAASPTTQP